MDVEVLDLSSTHNNIKLKKFFMKKYFIFFLLMLFVIQTTKANNLTISTPSYNDANKTLTFTIAWENSWRITGGPNNYDGIWLFIKRQACSSTNAWATALLSTTSADHVAAAVTGGAAAKLLTVDAVSDGMGVFVRRQYNGIGNIPSHTITLQLNSSLTTSPAITTTANDNFKILGIEMVYIPQGEFYIGDGRQTNTNNFSNGNNSGTPLRITAAMQAAGIGASTVYTSSPSLGCPNFLPSTFPLGFNGFWCMKYEIGVAAYTDFLNSLSYNEQAARLAKWGTRYPNSINQEFNANINTRIWTTVAGVFNTVPATFSFNAGWAWVPVTYLSWLDLTAYLDWSGLRPMNEFEYEKVCRGPLNPIPNEYPWGSTTINKATGYGNNAGTNSMRHGNVGLLDGLAMYEWNDQNGAPYRSGSFANSTTTRAQSGATYYGVMEMGGNVSEQVVGGGSGYDFSNFTTANGDGILGSDGNANTAGWPNLIGANDGNYIKGGDFQGQWGTYPNMLQVSDRQAYNGNTYNNGLNPGTGGRGVRSFPMN
jgi:formylglycine-generating enzyme required for sulfatase activity